MKTDPDCQYEGSTLVFCTNSTQDFHSNDYSVVIHSQYDPSTEYNDIALVKLKKPANIHQNNIKIICLPFDEKDIANKMIVIGFGLYENSTYELDTSSVMMKGLVSHISNEDCTEKYGGAFNSRPLTKNQFCAAGNNKGKYVDTCKGESFLKGVLRKLRHAKNNFRKN
jgi:secreted trypsin-like serine protease